MARFGYVAKGRYAEQVADLQKRLGADRVMVLVFERDIVAKPIETFQRVSEFVGAGRVDTIWTPSRRR